MGSQNNELVEGNSRKGIEDVFVRYLTKITSEISTLTDELIELNDDLSQVAQSLKSSSQR